MSIRAVKLSEMATTSLMQLIRMNMINGEIHVQDTYHM